MHLKGTLKGFHNIPNFRSILNSENFDTFQNENILPPGIAFDLAFNITSSKPLEKLKAKEWWKENNIMIIKEKHHIKRNKTENIESAWK